jgi:hypothetical protein
MEAVFPPEFTRTGTVDVRSIPATGKKRNAAVSARIYTESSWYPLGNDRKQQRNSPDAIPLQISPEFLIPFDS